MCPPLPTHLLLLQSRPLFDGLLTRVISCELQYGPLSCEFVWRGTNQPVFDEVTLPQVGWVQATCVLCMPRAAVWWSKSCNLGQLSFSTWATVPCGHSYLAAVLSVI